MLLAVSARGKGKGVAEISEIRRCQAESGAQFRDRDPTVRALNWLSCVEKVSGWE